MNDNLPNEPTAEQLKKRDRDGVPIIHYASGYLPPDVADAIVAQRKREFALSTTQKGE